MIEERIHAKRNAAVFLDFDGTLAAIAMRPNRVRVKPVMRNALRELARHKHATVVVVSGRQRAELKRYLAIPNLNHVGLYGWERNGNETIAPATRMALLRAQVLILKELSTYPGVWIEPKGSSFSIHLLNAKPSVQRRARLAVRKFLLRFSGKLQIFENLRDIEVAPAWMPDKGVAVSELLTERSRLGALPFFFGDDLSDEPAFAAVRGGVSVLVGKPRSTRAQFWLRSPNEVAVTLKKIREALG